MKQLTTEEKMKFIDLYMKGYSAMKIFRELGQYPEYETAKTGYERSILTNKANDRMTKYRKSLNLPKRGIGFKPTITFRKSAKPKEPEYYI